MNNYASPSHQNLSVWARRAGIEIKDLDAAVKYTEANFGVGRRATLRYVAEQSLLAANIGPNTSRFVGCVVAQAVYDVVYQHQSAMITHAQFTKELSKYHLPPVGHQACLRYADVAIAMARDLAAARDREHHANGQSLTGMILNKVRGR